MRSGRTRRPRRRPTSRAGSRPPPGATRASSGRGPRRGSGPGHAVARGRMRGRRRPRSSGRLGLAAGHDEAAELPVRNSSTAWSSRAAKTGDGRPSYWAAPEDDDRAGRPVLVAAAPGPRSGTSRTRRAAATTASPTKQMRPTIADHAIGRCGEPSRHRPWHFLYFRPEPQKHGSLRPIRWPAGVNPGRRPPAAPLAGRTADDLVAERLADAPGRLGPLGRPRVAGDAAAATARGRPAPGRSPSAEPSAVRAVAGPAVAGRQRRTRGRPIAVGPVAAAGAGWRVTVTRKIVVATWWRMRSRSSA